jgi:hypothetical protein
MNNAKKKKTEWKQKIIHEMKEYYINVIYLAFFFGLFTNYRRLILAQYHISYLNYGESIIEALVLGKVIMIGNILRLDKSFQQRPLIFPTIFRAFVFSVWVALYKVIEQTVIGLVHGNGLEGGFSELLGKGSYELIAGSLVIFFAFIPFFAIKELGRVIGKGKLSELFFRRRTFTEYILQTKTTTHPSA